MKVIKLLITIMKILVTGGCGFIGSHLCQRLLKEGNQVLCIDNLMTGSLDNISDIIDLVDFKFVNANIRDQITVDFKPDQIYDLACPASPVHYQNASLETLLTCLQGSINVLNFAEKHKARVLLSSTSEVYGDPEISPQVQQYWGNVNPVGVRSCYDQGKRASQTLFIQYNRVKGVDIRIARIFNTYGPKLDQLDGRVVSNFISQALRGEPITIYGDGLQTRSFCFIEDQVQGLIKLMNSKEYFKPINIGNPQEITIKQLATIVVNMCESKSEVIYCDLPQDDPKKRNPDITKAKKYLNWEPKFTLQQGLKKTIIYFRQLHLKQKQKKSKEEKTLENPELGVSKSSTTQNASENVNA